MKLLRSGPLTVIGLMLGAAFLSFFIFRHGSDAAPTHITATPLISVAQQNSHQQ